jgi:hypothetical protein
MPATAQQPYHRRSVSRHGKHLTRIAEHESVPGPCDGNQAHRGSVGPPLLADRRRLGRHRLRVSERPPWPAPHPLIAPAVSFV